MRVLKAWLPDDALQLDSAALGTYIKLKALASQMTVKGVMVNGKVLSIEDMAERADLGDGWEMPMETLIQVGYLRLVNGVWFFSNSKELFHGTRYASTELGNVKSIVEQTVKSSVDILDVMREVRNAGEFEHEKSTDDIRASTLQQYERFGDRRGIMISYIACFRTKVQVTNGSKMDPAKHLRLVNEMVVMFDAKEMEFKGKKFPFTDEMFFRAIDITVQRKLVELKNHNYFKVVLSNQLPVIEKGKTNGRGTDEGY